MSWIYIVGVIIFAIVSNVNKAQKGKGKQKSAPRKGMPTFGGYTEDGRKPDIEGSGFPVPGQLYSPMAKTSLTPQEDSDYDASPAFMESALSPTPDYETGEGMSMEQPWADTSEERSNKGNPDYNQLYSAYNQVSAADNVKRRSAPDAGEITKPSNQMTSVNPRQLQNGLIWAEILSPPRSKRPFHHGRQG